MDLGIGVGHGILNILLHKYFVPKGTFKICVIAFSTNSAYLKATEKVRNIKRVSNWGHLYEAFKCNSYLGYPQQAALRHKAKIH